ncbi:MAG: Gfo/Idh/MocA family oxidoreductase [Planctomycetota bacterium]|nr:Gfo/Idh/MocA family oxidoreductase [Planctomycetota bacterium]
MKKRGRSTPKVVRVGVVGVGGRGTFLMKTLLSIPGVEVRAVADASKDNAARAQGIVREKQGSDPAAYVGGASQYEKMCAREDLDAVVCGGPWEIHVPVMVAAMKHGKYGATEVPAATTVEECWDLVNTSEKTGMPCMMLENVCYFQNVLTVLRMVREACFGELIHFEAGYQHDVRMTKISKEGAIKWRGAHSLNKNGNLYPTHQIGPIAQWANINRGDRFDYLTSMSSNARGINDYAAKLLGKRHPLAKKKFALGDVNCALIKSVKGLTVTLYHDTNLPRPYDLIFRCQGVKGLYMGTVDGVYLDGVSPEHHKYEPFAPYMKKYAHPLWKGLQKEAARNGGHGGGDYITLWEFVRAVRNKTEVPIDVYDAATWSVITPLTIESVKKGSAPVKFPDFTRGKWKTRKPLPISKP